MTRRHVDPDLDRRWEEFHSLVNMTSVQLREHLMTEAAGESAFPDKPDLGTSDEGRHVLAVLGKRKTDLTDDDVELIGHVVERVNGLLAERPPDVAGNDGWRRRLMDLGHDPLRGGSPARES